MNTSLRTIMTGLIRMDLRRTKKKRSFKEPNSEKEQVMLIMILMKMKHSILIWMTLLTF